MMDTAAAYFRKNRIYFLLLLPFVAVLYATIMPDLFDDWLNDPNYSHGLLVPFISGWFAWQRRGDLQASEVRSSNAGLVVIFTALVMLIVGAAGTEYFTQRISLVLLLAGIILYWFGREVLRILALPVVFLVFMVPLPYIVYDAIAFPLKLLVAKVSVATLKAAGVIVWREGNIIMFPNVTLEVADACSGLRSLMSLLAIGVSYAFIFHNSRLQRILLILMAVPIAMISNMFRVIATGFLAQYYGAAAAEGFFHEFAGLAVFALAMGLLLLTGMILRRIGR
ncbi:exosortase A [Desulfuromonas sp. TF]|uniref:exosortase A n=1 Tax=Desulfuromonas sp. TF TaxID=1232410 RepID=UPI000410837D|nr:exosortase A [Desulfuromonas sp. TF]